jgi:hypothetical protein
MQEELEAACRAANLDAFIADLPDGYDTVVGVAPCWQVPDGAVVYLSSTLSTANNHYRC